ncbi:MAG: methyltransferase domain-containing protein [Planctomycetes bacterium]|nr:methyltransferase domain-containing protein [Planctomycetota bacterium]
MDRHELYERCVQAPERLVPFLRAIHGGSPTVLGEDFCGTAALSRRWVRSVPGGSAIALDHDAEVLALAAARATDEGARGIEFVRGDARSASDLARHACDVLFVGNFSIGEIAARSELVAYLRRSRARLLKHGTFICDLYGGASAFRTGAVERLHALSDGRRIRYTWEQRSADPRSARVENALHFRVERRGEIEEEWTAAFVYRWRLWSPAELCDAFDEAGYGGVGFWRDLPEGDAPPRPVETPDELGENWIVCVSAQSSARA